jgi:sugar lactone lactonase YvrE
MGRRTLRYGGAGLAGVFALLLVWLIWPARIDPAYWDEPDAPPMTGPLAANERLASAEILAAPDYVEGVLPDRSGGVFYNGLDSALLRRTAGGDILDIAHLPGARLIGLDWMPDGRIAAAGGNGLYAIDPDTGAYDLLSQGAPARPFGFVNDLAVAPDGLIYFTDSTIRWARPGNLPAYLNDMLENRPHGLVLCFNPATRSTVVVSEQLYYPNGIAISPDGDYLLVAETYRYQIRRIWIDGPNAGQTDIFADNLPGLPDGLTFTPDGRLVAAMATPRIDAMAWMHRNPWQLSMLTKLPERIWRGSARSTQRGFLLVLNENGAIIDSLQTQAPDYGIISNIIADADGEVWFGSLSQRMVAHIGLGAPATAEAERR